MLVRFAAISYIKSLSSVKGFKSFCPSLLFVNVDLD